jgi:hypothetical protein
MLSQGVEKVGGERLLSEVVYLPALFWLLYLFASFFMPV